MVRGKPVQDALDMLKFTKKRAAPLVSKLISSAAANASANTTVDVDRLIVGRAFVDEAKTEEISSKSSGSRYSN